jgi:hypothetical protein
MNQTSPKGALGNEERAKFIDLIRGGMGIQMALRQMGTHYRRYKRTLKDVRGFKADVGRAFAVQLEQLIMLRFAAATDDSEPSAAARAQEFLINRIDSGKRFAREMKLRRAEIEAKEGASRTQAPIDSAVAAAMIHAGLLAADAKHDNQPNSGPRVPTDNA